jgi:hypothetical protein
MMLHMLTWTLAAAATSLAPIVLPTTTPPTPAQERALESSGTVDASVDVIATDAPASALIERARVAFDAQAWQSAAIALQQARARMDDPPPVLAYDEGVAWAKAGDLHQARTAFAAAMRNADSPEIAADAAFNLGNVAHTLAQSDGDQSDQHAAIEELTTALNHYREVIAHTPDDPDAHANAQLTWQRIEVLKEQQEQQEQDKDEQSDDQDQQEQSDDQNQEDQQDDQQQDPQQQNQDQQDPQQQNTEQQEQQNQDPQDQEPQDQNPQDEEQQDPEQQPSDKQQPEPKPTEAKPSPAEQKPMTREEAQRLLQRVRDRERERVKQDAPQGLGQPSTGKDW